MITPARRSALSAVVAACAAISGALVAVHYHRLDLTLSHYDARGHLAVARRIFDSITPGWQQIGAVWLPLPHLLNALPVQIDAFYRTGASAVAISVVSFAVATAAIAWMVVALTNSALAGIAGAAVFALNPNVLYLQSTPMTEPLLLALTVVAVALLMAYVDALSVEAPVRRVDRPTNMTAPDRPALRSATGWALVLACLTRYEAWPVTAAALTLGAWTRWRQGHSPRQAILAMSRVALYPGLAVVAFLIFSRIVVGEWFVAGGFFVPENRAQGDVYETLAEIAWGLRALSGLVLVAVAAAGALALLFGALRDARRPYALPLALAATAALPAAAFFDGHPFRIRYMVPLIAAQAVLGGVAAGAWKRARVAAPIAVLAVALLELHPLDRQAPMVVEAQWDRPNIAVRRQVSACLAARYRGDTIMASMGSLGHYMQDLSREGFALRDFLHEGNGDIWLAALDEPRPYVGWILIEEKAEGGDMLARRARENPHFLDGFSRVCEGAGVALYRRGASEPDAESRRVSPAAQIDLQ